MKTIINRVHRVQGQLAGVEDALKRTHTCDDVLPQLLAVKGSIDSLVRAYLEMSLDACTKNKRPESMRKIIKTLIART